LLALVAARLLARIWLGARQFVAGGNAILGAVGAGRFFAGLARAQHPALGVVFVRSLGDAIEVELGRDVDARAPRAHDRADDGFDLLTQPPFIGELTLVGAGACAALVVRGAVGQ